MATKKSKAQLQAELSLIKRANSAMAWATGITTTLKSLIKWGSLCFLGWCAYLSIDSLAGRSTDANIVLNLLANIGINKWLAYFLAGGGVVYGIAERNLRKRTAKKLGGRIAQLELELDPRRSSSRLSPDGTTNPRDED